MDALASALHHRLKQVTPRALTGDRRAGILVPLVESEAGPALLLTRRTETLGSHKGQVAFPGGRVDETDLNITATALREAEEEVGLLPSAVKVFGLLDDIPTSRGQTMVTPVVGRIIGTPQLRPSPQEVARIFTIPIAELQDKTRWRVRDMAWRGRDWPVYFFDHDGETLWGLSAYVTLKLLGFIPGGSPYTVPVAGSNILNL